MRLLTLLILVGAEIKDFGAMAFIFCDESVEAGLESAQMHRLLEEFAIGEEGPHLGAVLAGSPRHADIEKQRHALLVGASQCGDKGAC